MSDDIEIIGNEVYPLPIIIYGSSEDESTRSLRRRLEEFEIPFVEVNIVEDETAARYVEHINHGSRITPTIVFGDEEFIIVEPTRAELIQALRRAKYEV